MKYQAKIGILTQKQHPLISFWMSKLMELDLGRFCVIVDEKEFTLKNKNLFNDRTNGFFVKKLKKNLSQREWWIDNDIFYVSGHNSSYCLDLIQEANLDILVNCGTPVKLSQELLSSVPHGVLNVHPGLLPKYRGASAVEWSLWNEDPVGATAHIMSADYDDGPIIESMVLELEKHSSYHQIRIANYLLAGNLMRKVISDWNANGRVPFRLIKQNNDFAKVWPPMPDEIFCDLLEKLK